MNNVFHHNCPIYKHRINKLEYAIRTKVGSASLAPYIFLLNHWYLLFSLPSII